MDISLQEWVPLIILSVLNPNQLKRPLTSLHVEVKIQSNRLGSFLRVTEDEEGALLAPWLEIQSWIKEGVPIAAMFSQFRLDRLEVERLCVKMTIIEQCLTSARSFSFLFLQTVRASDLKNVSLT